MTATSTPVPARSLQIRRRRGVAAARLMRLELCHNAMLWILPVAVAVFWFVSYRKIMATPPVWVLRASDFQSGIAADFIVPVVGAAVWMGSREARRHMTDLMTITARPRWTRLLGAWAATTMWALVGFLICLAVVYGVTAHEVTWGGPLWWPAAVAAACLPAYCALGFVAGVLLPSRFTAPVAAIASFFLLVLSTELITGSHSYWQISPVVAGPWDVGPDPAVGIFYPYVPDLSIAQLMFLIGLVIAVLGVMALQGSARPVRVAAAALAAAGLLAAGTAVKLTGTGTLDAHGMMTIPALHDAASDRPIQFTPVCSRTPIPVCLNPAYASYLPAVTTGLDPVLLEIAGLPGAPVRVIQVAATYQQGAGNEVAIGLTGDPLRGEPPEFRLLLPDPTGGASLSMPEMADLARTASGPDLIANLVGDGPGASQAQHAVAAALSLAARLPVTGSVGHLRRSACSSRTSADCHPAGSGVLAVSNSEYAAAQRFDALPLPARRAWLARYLPALRAGQIALAQLP
ncbi:MAG: hypothetical protein ACRDOK_01380 [Streptosporangiaceae bacterium]